LIGEEQSKQSRDSEQSDQPAPTAQPPQHRPRSPTQERTSPRPATLEGDLSQHPMRQKRGARRAADLPPTRLQHPAHQNHRSKHATASSSRHLGQQSLRVSPGWRHPADNSASDLSSSPMKLWATHRHAIRSAPRHHSIKLRTRHRQTTVRLRASGAHITAPTRGRALRRDGRGRATFHPRRPDPSEATRITRSPKRSTRPAIPASP